MLSGGTQRSGPSQLRDVDKKHRAFLFVVVQLGHGLALAGFGWFSPFHSGKLPIKIKSWCRK